MTLEPGPVTQPAPLELVDDDQEPLLLPVARTVVLELPVRGTAPLVLPTPERRELVLSAAPVPGPPGPPGVGNVLQVVLREDVNAGYAVALDVDDRGRPASSLDPDDVDRVAGIALVAGAPGDRIDVIRLGEWTRPTPGPVGALFLGEHGELTTDPDTGAVSFQLATAVTATRVLVNLRNPVYS